MSETIVEQDTPRLQRSVLAVPGSNLRALDKAPELTADAVFLDCNDASQTDKH